METPKEWSEFANETKQIFDADLKSENELKKSKQAEFASQANELKTSAKSETLYRKVAVSKRKPIKSGTYFSNEEEVYYRESTNKFEHNYDAHCVYPEWWLDEMELPDNEESLLKQNEELREMLEDINRRYYLVATEPDGIVRETMIDSLTDGIEELLNKVKPLKKCTYCENYGNQPCNDCEFGRSQIKTT